MRETVLNMFVYDGTFPKFGQSGLKNSNQSYITTMFRMRSYFTVSGKVKPDWGLENFNKYLQRAFAQTSLIECMLKRSYVSLPPPLFRQPASFEDTAIHHCS